MTSNEDKKDKKREPRPPRKISPEYLFRSGMYYLERYSSSIDNFRQVMSRKIIRSSKHYEENPSKHFESLEELIEKLIKLGYLNDESYTRGQVRSYRRKGEGKRKIIQRIKLKGVDDDLISHVIDEIDAEDNQRFDRMDDDIDTINDPELKAALTYIKRKKLGIYRRKKDEKSKQKDLASLARAGYSYNIASKALDLSVDFETEEI